MEYFALIYLENEPYPEIEIELFIDKAPNTVANFIKLVEEGFYDGLAFHHVAPHELVQTGDPTGTGDGGPGYTIKNEFHPDLRHNAAGVVAMAVFSDPERSAHGSQFYITLAPIPDRDGLNPDGSPKDCENLDVACHSIFGRVIKGMHLINADSEPLHPNAVREGDVIQKIEIIAQYPADSLEASIPADCLNGIVVPRPKRNPELVLYCEILLAIKESLAGEAKLNWNDRTTIWEWHGITIIDPNVPLINLDLHRRGLTGFIPKELSELTGLSELDISHNNLVSFIPPELANIKSLKSLTLMPNEFEGCIHQQLKQFISGLVTIPFCDNSPSYHLPHAIFEGGADLSVRYIERQPRYPRYQVTYYVPYSDDPFCPYPFDEDIGPVLCNPNPNLKRMPDPGDIVQLTAHVQNVGDSEAGEFEFVWSIDGQPVQTGSHDGLAAGSNAEIEFEFVWPDHDDNPLLTFEVDPDNMLPELLEDNNFVSDWIKGHTLGIYFSSEAYDSLILSNEPGSTIQSPEHWFHDNLKHLNQMLINAGVEDRIRTELFIVFFERSTDVAYDPNFELDGWWGIWHHTPIYTLEGYRNRPDIDIGLLHELLHQIGLIDIYQMHLGPSNIRLPDANRQMHPAGCGPDYWPNEWTCFRFYNEIDDIMGDLSPFIGTHSAQALALNTRYRRGYQGEFLLDTPTITSIKLVNQNGEALENVELRFYQKQLTTIVENGRRLSLVDDTPEFIVNTNKDGNALLPNRGPTGVETATGHQLRPNPFGLIDIHGINGIFIIEMTSDECTNYDWLTLIELNLAYWDGQTEHAEFTKTLRCPPPR